MFDNRRYGSTNPYHFWTLLFRVRLVGGEATRSAETTEVAFFRHDGLPEDMSGHQRALAEHAFAAPSRAAFQ